MQSETQRAKDGEGVQENFGVAKEGKGGQENFGVAKELGG